MNASESEKVEELEKEVTSLEKRVSNIERTTKYRDSTVLPKHSFSTMKTTTEMLDTIVEKVAELIVVDDVTGLAVPFSLEQWIIEQQTQRTGTDYGFILIDLDYLLNVSKRLGRAYGDEYLKEMYNRILLLTREEDLAVRIGVDDILFIACGVHSLEDVELIAKKLLKSIQQPLIINNVSVYPSASIGATILQEEEPVGIALARADDALYQAKCKGRNQVSMAA